GGSVDAEAVDLLGIEADEGVAEPGSEIGAAGRNRLGASADLEHAWCPGIDRYEVVDQDRRRGVRLDVAVFLRRRDVMAADVERAEIGVVVERRRHDVRLAVGSGGCDPAETLACEVVDLRVREFGHSCSNTPMLRVASRIPTSRWCSPCVSS